MSSALVIARDDRLACREWISHHSKSFYLSSLLLPAAVREAAWALYAFCRRADDAVDEEGASSSEALARVDGLRRRLDLVYRGEPPSHPIDRAFATVVERYALPRGLPEALLAGMEMDARGATYEDEETLLLYCYRVAAVVGLMMTRIMIGPDVGQAPPIIWLRAADLGAAMQMTNIARDVGEDARRGRVYLPRTWLAEAGTSSEEVLAARHATPAIRATIKRLLTVADAHYRAADAGVPLLPRRCRLAIASSRRIYAAIGARVAANDHDSVSTRAYVSLGGKLALVARAVPAVFFGRVDLGSTGPADAQLRRWIGEAGLPT